MSFSSEIKEELSNRMDSAKHCQIAELAAILAFCGEVTADCLVVVTENHIVADKYIALLDAVSGIKREDVDWCQDKKKGSAILVTLNEEQSRSVLMTVKWIDVMNGGDFVRCFANPHVIQKECCKRAFIRGAFLAAGSVSDPNKFYHYEIVCDREEDAEKLAEIMAFFNLDAKYIARKKTFVVYLKEGSHITDCLNIMGAYVSQMNLMNVMILKDMRNDVNRKVNCETANLNKTVEAAVKQINDIEYIRDTVGLSYLKDSLQEVAVVRLENPDMNLKDIGKLLTPEVGKSGVNHRLRKISEIAEELRGS
jgi:hypothetical protein